MCLFIWFHVELIQSMICVNREDNRKGEKIMWNLVFLLFLLSLKRIKPMYWLTEYSLEET